MPAFIGRQPELKLLESYYDRKLASLIVIKGRRRIGKSRLVAEFSKNKGFYKFVGLAPKPGIDAQTQRDFFAQTLRQYFPEIPSLKADDWMELFLLLAKFTQKKKAVILFDEISWLADSDVTFLPKLKNAWDEAFKSNDQLMLILCSSISLWLDKNILSSTEFLGRIHYVMNLRELPLNVCNAFWGEYEHHISSYDKFKFLSISGGVPLYLENLDPRLPVEQNIQQLCFTEGGLLLREFDNIFHDLFSKRSEIYKNILSTLVDTPSDIKKICATLNTHQNGLITEYLLDLSEAGFISRDHTWDTKNGHFSKLSRYRLSDNYVRFYLKYLQSLKLKVEQSLFSNKSLSSLPEWSIMMGLQFENLILNNRALIWKKLNLNNNDIVIDGAFFQNTTTKQKGCQIDYMIQTQYRNLFICEIKFSRNQIQPTVIKEVQEKIDRLKHSKGFSCLPVLIHVNGVTDAIIDSGFFSKIIDFSELLTEQ